MQTFDYGESYSVAHTPNINCFFLIALRSPFCNLVYIAFPPSATLCRKTEDTYLLFLNGFAYHSIRYALCQYLLPFFSKPIYTEIKFISNMSNHMIFLSQNIECLLNKSYPYDMISLIKRRIYQS